MKLLFIQPTADKRGHYGVWTSKLCQALGKTGHEIVLVTNKINTERYLDEPRSFRAVEADNGAYAFERFDACWTTRPGYYWYGYFHRTYRIVKEALDFCRREPFDAVFLTDAEYLTASLLLRRYRGVIPPVFWHVQAANFTYGTYAGSFAKKTYKVFQKQIFRQVLGNEVKGLVVLGEFHRERLRDQLSLDKAFPIEVIPDGGEVPEYLPDRSTARREIGIEYEGPVFLFLGMLRRDKGIECLLEAVSHLKQEEFKVVIAGSCFDYSPSDIAVICDRLGVGEKVILRLSYIEDSQLLLYYRAGDAVVLPYRRSYTGSCGPLIKGACSCRQPVIATNVANIGRFVLERGVGLVAEPENAEVFAGKMREFLHLTGAQKQSFADNAAAVARSCSWDAIAGMLIDYVARVVRQQAQREAIDAMEVPMSVCKEDQL